MRPLLIALVAVVVLVAAAAAGFRVWYGQQPPVLDQSGPGTVLRLTSESGGVPPPRTQVRLASGAVATVSLAGIDSGQGRPVGLVLVVPAGQPGRQLALAEGQTGSVGAFSVTVLHVWQMPDAANDAIDVRVLGSS